MTRLLNTLKIRHLFAFALLALLTTLPAAAEGLWLHVEVDSGNQDERVTVNLPLSLIEKALPMIPAEALAEGSIQFEGSDFTIDNLREMWRELESQDDFTIAHVESPDETVRVAKEGAYLTVRVEGTDENVRARIPVAVVDALFSGTGEQLDIRGALEALAAHGEGELVTVVDKNDTVRVWVDGFAEVR